MENYIVSARKYRPDTFESVVGQEALTTTLKNAIAANKLAHAYLFCGSRGVGKTTCARIFAKTINCLNKTDDGEACDQCESCKAFNEHRSYNIHELDAASNNTVDDIRQLIDMVRIQPQIGKYRVFIIDEVHMLSTQAFNAFLKTLEEPPAHAIFILATTEKHKLLPTILSRCQIYDFNRIGVQDIVDHLLKIAQTEKMEVEPEALNVIAIKADGGMRDALSMFDQAMSYTQGHLTYQGVIDNLNVLDYDYYFRLIDAFLKGSVVDSLLIFNEILSKGFEGNAFIVGLNGHCRDLLVSKDEVTLPLLQAAASIRERYKEQAKACSSKLLFRVMKLCRSCELNYKQSTNKRLLVELSLIEMAQIESDDDEGERPLDQSKQLKPIKKSDADTTSPKVNSSKPVEAAKGGQSSKSSAQKQEVKERRVEYTANGNSSSSSENLGEQESSVLDRLKRSGDSKRVPTIKKSDMGAGISLKKMRLSMQQREEKEATITEVNERSDAELRRNSFDDAALNYQWQSFINSMPIDLKALAVRMRDMRVELLPETFSFEVLVDNELAASDFTAIKRDVEAFLRKNLQNDCVEMKIRVREVGEQTRAYTKVEKYKLMASQNKALDEFRATFGLEFN